MQPLSRTAATSAAAWLQSAAAHAWRRAWVCLGPQAGARLKKQMLVVQEQPQGRGRPMPQLDQQQLRRCLPKQALLQVLRQ